MDTSHDNTRTDDDTLVLSRRQAADAASWDSGGVRARRPTPTVAARAAEAARRRPWSVARGVAVLGIGLLEWWGWLGGGMGHSAGFLLMVLLATGAALTSRDHPGVALGLVWCSALLSLVLGVPVPLVSAIALVVSFHCARHGDTALLVLSGLSIPLGSLVAGISRIPTVGAYPFSLVTGVLGSVSRSEFGILLLVAGGVLLGSLLLGVPWLAGLVLRSRDRAEAADLERRQAEDEAAVERVARGEAEEIARLTEQHAQLARDVHDVVGHSLAVILAQAESGQYLPDDDPARLKRTLATIATSARGSLREVRAVLAPGAERDHGHDASDLDALLAGLDEQHDVVTQVSGEPRPLPPELATVAYRVLQEMLTNALRHGVRGGRVSVEQHWPDGVLDDRLRLEVVNAVDSDGAPVDGADGGRGLAGMRTRLEAVGGALDVRRRALPGGTSFTVTAWVPVRPQEAP